MLSILQNTLITNKRASSKVFIVVLVAVFALYVGLSLYMATTEYKIKSLQEKLTSMERANTQLQVKLSSAASLGYVLEKSSEFAYIEIKNIRYIEKRSELPFALEALSF